MNVQQLIKALSEVPDKTSLVVFERINGFGITVDYVVHDLELIRDMVVLK